MNMLRLSLVLALTTTACSERRDDHARDTEPAPTDASPALTMAHEAYLSGDYVTMGERLKEVIVDPRTGELARDNAYALLESAYEATRGQLPARAAVPSDVSVITLGVLNGAHAWSTHRLIYLYMRLAAGRAAHIKEMRVTKLPSEPILSLADKRGTLQVEHSDAGFDDVKLEVRDLPSLPERGAFGVEVVFDDGPSIDAFVLANKLVGSAQPEVTSPTMGQVFSDPRPEIAWRSFRSPEHAPWEIRGVNVWIARENAKEHAFNFYRWDPGELSKVTAGPFEPDTYWLSLVYTEDRAFGGIHVQRAMETGRRFSVVR